MQKPSGVVRYTEAELAALPSEAEFVRVDAMSAGELEAAIAADPDWRDVPDDWYRTAVPVFPGEVAETISIRVDRDVLAWFKKQGSDYPTRMGAALRAFMIAQENAKR